MKNPFKKTKNWVKENPDVVVLVAAFAAAYAVTVWAAIALEKEIVAANAQAEQDAQKLRDAITSGDLPYRWTYSTEL